MDDQVSKENLMERKQCTAMSKQSGERCKRWPTPGREVCIIHGGRAGRPIEHGLYSKKLAEQPGIQQRIQELKEHPELLDLTTHLAATVAFLERLVSEEPDDTDKRVQTLSQVIDRISKLKEREHKIQVGYFLTPEQQQAWLKQLIGVINQEVEDGDIKQRIADRMLALSSG